MPFKTSGTCAREAVDTVDAGAPIEAAIRSAIVDVDFAVRSLESCSTLASIAVHAIDARAAIGTRICVAVIDIDFAVCTLESRKTFAGIALDAINTATTIGAEVNGTVIDVDAIFSITFKTRITDAVSAAVDVFAHCVDIAASIV